MLKRSQKIAYGIGNSGLALVNIVTQTWLLYFLAPGTGRILIPASLVGAIWLAGRVVDALIDPPLATWSDRCRSKLGRRLPFMLWSGLPLGLITVVLFSEGAYSALGASPVLRGVFLALYLGAFYFLFSVWAVPYNALVADLSRDERERVDLSTSAAIFNLAGTGIAMIGFGKVVDSFTPRADAAAQAAGAAAPFSGPAFLYAAMIIGVLAIATFYASTFGLLRLKTAGDEPSSLSFFKAAGAYSGTGPSLPTSSA